MVRQAARADLERAQSREPGALPLEEVPKDPCPAREALTGGAGAGIVSLVCRSPCSDGAGRSNPSKTLLSVLSDSSLPPAQPHPVSDASHARALRPLALLIAFWVTGPRPSTALVTSSTPSRTARGRLPLAALDHRVHFRQSPWSAISNSTGSSGSFGGLPTFRLG